eukprot:Gb_12378 [translate_table: standard]
MVRAVVIEAWDLVNYSQRLSLTKGLDSQPTKKRRWGTLHAVANSGATGDANFSYTKASWIGHNVVSTVIAKSAEDYLATTGSEQDQLRIVAVMMTIIVVNVILSTTTLTQQVLIATVVLKYIIEHQELLCEISARDTGAPSNLVHVTTKFGETGEVLVSSVDKAIFIRFTTIGNMVMENATKILTSVRPELSGKDASIICDYVDVPCVAQIVYPMAENAFALQEFLVETLYGLSIWDRGLVNVIKYFSKPIAPGAMRKATITSMLLGSILCLEIDPCPTVGTSSLQVPGSGLNMVSFKDGILKGTFYGANSLVVGLWTEAHRPARHRILHATGLD